MRGGRCVRLFQGDYDRETVYGDDPVAAAERWLALGASRLHVVDLDGARAGQPANRDVLAAICAAVPVPIEVSGGLRTLDAVDDAVGYGAARVQLGSAAVRDPGLVRDAAARYPEAIVVSIDARGGKAYTDGWREGSGRDALALAGEMATLGVGRVMVTDIGRDGALGGPNVEFLAGFVAALSIPVVASGGVSSLDDLRALAGAGCEGAIIGTALYEGRLDLREALEVAAAC